MCKYKLTVRVIGKFVGKLFLLRHVFTFDSPCMIEARLTMKFANYLHSLCEAFSNM